MTRNTMPHREQVPGATRLEQRAQDAISRLMSRRLLLPTIFFNARWERSYQPDVLAIDRSGVGDVHLIEIKAKPSLTSLRKSIRDLLQYHANYLWLALVDPGEALPGLPRTALLNPQGMGRIGLILVSQNQSGDLAAQIAVEAERFPGSFYDRADRFVEKHKPDLQFR